jgi:hypothetical protein
MHTRIYTYIGTYVDTIYTYIVLLDTSLRGTAELHQLKFAQTSSKRAGLRCHSRPYRNTMIAAFHYPPARACQPVNSDFGVLYVVTSTCRLWNSNYSTREETKLDSFDIGKLSLCRELCWDQGQFDTTHIALTNIRFNNNLTIPSLLQTHFSFKERGEILCEEYSVVYFEIPYKE